ncbi:MAG: hypothetical protein WCK65_03650 [Rhodospirillaceae bacterium]
MNDEPENLTLVYLRRIDQRQDRMELGLREMRERLTALELGQATIIRHVGALAETDARVQAGMDHMRDDIQRINRHLDITSGAA